MTVQMTVDWLGVDGYLRLKGMVCTVPDLWQKVSAKFQVNDVTFRTVVARMIIENMKGKVVDIDNAFLNGDLEHEIYMKIPEGYDDVINPGVDKEDC